MAILFAHRCCTLIYRATTRVPEEDMPHEMLSLFLCGCSLSNGCNAYWRDTMCTGYIEKVEPMQSS